MNSADDKLMDIRIDFVQNSAGGNSTYIRGIPTSGSGTPEIRLGSSSMAIQCLLVKQGLVN